jgi:hypothetical protein
MPAMPKPIDLDALLDPNDAEPAVVVVRLFGRDWKVLSNINTFSLSAISGGDTAAISRFLRNMVVPDERDDFAAAFADQPNLDGERLGKILTVLIEAVSGNPTTAPSGSSPRATKKTSAPKSPAR